MCVIQSPVPASAPGVCSVQEICASIGISARHLPVRVRDHGLCVRTLTPSAHCSHSELESSFPPSTFVLHHLHFTIIPSVPRSSLCHVPDINHGRHFLRLPIYLPSCAQVLPKADEGRHSCTSAFLPIEGLRLYYRHSCRPSRSSPRI